MRAKEDYTRFVIAGVVLAVATLAAFQLYNLREPARIHSAEAADQAAAVNAGRALFATNCTTCHGQNGEGVVGPALNSQGLLKTTSDSTLMALIRSGVPGTVMPAWGQAFGGPLTDEQVTQLTAFVRAWEPTAPNLAAKNQAPDPARGAAIFATTCFICHGDNGAGTKGAPAINDRQRLQQFDDAWYRNTIANGRPAKGMPTWGTVLSPAQIDDLVALIGAWRKGQTVAPAVPIKDNLNGTLFALEGADALDAVFHLNAALSQANAAQAQGIQAALDAIKKNDLLEADNQVRILLGLPPANASTDPVEAGKSIYAANCAPCHGTDGTGLIGPNLHTNAFIQSKNDADLVAFILAGRSGTAMTGFQGKLSDKQLGQIIGLLRTWQPTAAPVQSASTPVPPTNTPTPAATPLATPTVTATVVFTIEVARPSNPGGPGPAVDLKSDEKAGAQVFATNCVKCHGLEGKGGVKNPGSTDGEVPGLNPVDPSLIADDAKTYASNLDLFIEHGSIPAGPSPAISMTAWGDLKLLTPQQIANVIAYVMSLNPPPARPSNAGGAGPALGLTGDVKAGTQVFSTNCVKCHGLQGKGGVKNPGSTDGTVPALNPIDATLASSDPKVFADNVDLFIEHGSVPEGPSPVISMTAWGDLKLLSPQQIADVIAYVMSLNGVAPTAAPLATPTVTATVVFTIEVARPSNAGGPGAAIDLNGNVKVGTQVYVANCAACHGPQGKGGVKNPGSTDGEVPALNPIDPTLIDADAKTYATNLDLFLEHGSTPGGTNPAFKMLAFGDAKTLTSQQIADVIAYLMSLNPPPARPSNAGGPGPALDLKGDAKAGAQVYTTSCAVCHGLQGKGGVKNPGSTDGTVPALNPIDETLAGSDAKVFAYNVDLFLEHGSTPGGTNPTLKMLAFGDTKQLTSQQIADVIAYVMSLNSK